MTAAPFLAPGPITMPPGIVERRQPENDEAQEVMSCVFRIPTPWVEALDEIGDELGKSRAALIREAVVEQLLRGRIADELLIPATRTRQRRKGGATNATQDQVDALLETYQNTAVSIDDVSRLVNVSYESARRVLQENEIPIRRGPRDPSGLTVQLLERLLHSDEVMVDALPSVTGLSVKTVQTLLDQRGDDEEETT